MIIIGFGSKAQNGKDTAAEAIHHYYTSQCDLLRLHGLGNNMKVVIMKFATALYQEVNQALKENIWETRAVDEIVNMNPTGKALITKHAILPANTTGRLHYVLPDWVQPDPNPIKSDLAPYGKHPKLLQWWGTEFRRSQDKNYWVKKAMLSIPDGTNLVLFTDVRFKNEAKAIKERGGHLVEVIRRNQDGTRNYSADRPQDHSSEIDLDGYNWDFRIDSKSAALTGEIAITIAEYIRGLEENK